MSLLNTLIPSLSRAAANGNGGPSPARRPFHTIEETEAAYAVTVFLPGVAKDGLEITDEDGELRIAGKPAATVPEGLAALYRESSDAAFELVLGHDGAVDAGKIGAELRDGVLSLTLAKAESAKPRKISVS
jgi:HSP20 family molecular chaperone IbpA